MNQRKERREKGRREQEKVGETQGTAAQRGTGLGQCKRRLDSAQIALRMLSDRSCVAARRRRVAVKK